MKTIFSIFLYVTKNNPIFAVPYRLFLAFIFQIYKHTTGGAFTIGLFNGKQAIVFPKCAISSQFVYASVPDKGEIDILRGLCDENTVFLDIGANVGAYSLMLCDKAVGGVYAFEPHPFTAGRCKMNFLLNGLDERRVIGMAMSDAKGFIHFTNDTNVTAMNKITNDETNSISVPVTTLDEWTKEMNLEANTNFIVKIDVEGFEASVLRGGADFFANADVRGLVIEIFDEHKSAVEGLLAGYGYALKNINGANYLAQKASLVR